MITAFQIILLIGTLAGILGVASRDFTEKQQLQLTGLGLASMAAFFLSAWLL